MKKALCTIQDGQFDKAQILELEAILKRHYATHVSADRLSVVWCVIPEGQAYTDYQASRSSIVTMECENGFPQSRRIALLEACEKDWRHVTGQHPDHIMLSLLDKDLFDVFVKSNQSRLSVFGRIRFLLHMVTSLISSKLGKGYMTFNPNM